MTTLVRLATSRLGLIVILCLALFTWHKIDKGSAVRDAVVRYVARVELQAAETEAQALRGRIERLETANAALRGSIAVAQQEARDAEAARLDYLGRTPAPPADCTVSPDLLDLLRGR
jgi:hypothetical protein